MIYFKKQFIVSTRQFIVARASWIICNNKLLRDQLMGIERYLRQILEEMEHPQPKTPIQTDNTTAEGVINNKIQPKCTKAMDMQFHWLRDRKTRGQFKIYWRPGGMNLADYFTKHHLPTHHVNVRAEFLTKVKDIAESR